MSMTETALNEMEEIVTAKQNGAAGNDQTPEELAVAHGIASYKRMENERNDLKNHLEKLEQVLTIAKLEIEGLRADAAANVTRLESYQHERDEAVGNLAVYQTLFTTLQGILRTFGIDHAPIVKEAPRKAR
jgi:chromosome segregation ATPase